MLRTVRYALIGHGVKDIAERLHLKPATVERHLRRAMGSMTVPGAHIPAANERLFLKVVLKWFLRRFF